MLTGYKSLKRFRSVSGEKTLAFLILPTEQNQHSFPMVQEESIVEFNGENYRIKQVNEKNRGPVFYKEVTAIHTFFDLIDDYVYDTYTGSKTFNDFLQFVFSGTQYTLDIVDTFYAQDWDKLGDDNRIALFQDGLKRYGAEFSLKDTHLTFKQKIGNTTDFQFRYSYNIKTINRSVKTNNLSTYIKGFGKRNEDGTYVVQSDYTSPNSNIFGIRHAKPVYDERYTTLDGLNARLKAELKDTPDVSITIDFVDLRRAGYPYDVPNEGDDVYLIYEPMNLDLDARIMDITEEFDEFNEYPLKTDVTLANFRNNMTNQFVEFSRTQKTVNQIVQGTRKLPYNVLDDAVKRATESLQSAQTELEFTNGIIARDKTDPNFIVLLNSNGIGISRDGGTTFKEAITSEGFVLSAGAIGQLAANNIQIGAQTTFDSGYDPTTKETPSGAQSKADAAGQSVRDDLRMTAPLPTSLTMSQDGITAETSDPTRYARFDYRGLYVNNGAVEIRRKDGFTTIIDGMINQSFDIQGSDPPHLVDTTVNGRFFETTMTDGNGGICNLYTFTRVARYAVFEIALMSSSVNESTAILAESGNESVWLGTASAFDTNEVIQTITLDLGVPDGTVYALKLMLKSYSTTNTAYCRKVRAYQTDFPPA